MSFFRVKPRDVFSLSMYFCLVFNSEFKLGSFLGQVHVHVGSAASTALGVVLSFFIFLSLHVARSELPVLVYYDAWMSPSKTSSMMAENKIVLATNHNMGTIPTQV